MSRIFRVYQKKRGHRRTGSGKLGSFGEAVFYACFFLAGCAGLVFFVVTMVVPEWRASHEFVETLCTVRAKELSQTRGDEGPLYRPDIQIEYRVGGETYVIPTYDMIRAYSSDRAANQAILDRFDVGKQYPCWYDPLHHDVAVLTRGYSWWHLLIFVVPISFVLLGAGGLLYCVMHWGKSAEHMAATARGGNPLGNLYREVSSNGDFPSIPAGADMTNSPGTRLRFRLPISAAPTWILVGVLAACVAWNGVVAVFMATLVGDYLAGNPQWLPTLFMIPFVLVGLGLIAFFLRQLMIATGIGPTLLEISDHPLRPGEPFRLFVSQTGRLRFNSFVAALICEEVAQYRQGTDTRTETRCVLRQPLYERASFDILRTEPLEIECEFSIPLGAMHSFKSGNNEVRWILRVEGDVAGWPDFSRSFPIIVHPAARGTAR